MLGFSGFLGFWALEGSSVRCKSLEFRARQKYQRVDDCDLIL